MQELSNLRPFAGKEEETNLFVDFWKRFYLQWDLPLKDRLYLDAVSLSRLTCCLNDAAHFFFREPTEQKRQGLSEIGVLVIFFIMYQ